MVAVQEDRVLVRLAQMLLEVQAVKGLFPAIKGQFHWHPGVNQAQGVRLRPPQPAAGIGAAVKALAVFHREPFQGLWLKAQRLRRLRIGQMRAVHVPMRVGAVVQGPAGRYKGRHHINEDKARRHFFSPLDDCPVRVGIGPARRVDRAAMGHHHHPGVNTGHSGKILKDAQVARQARLRAQRGFRQAAVLHAPDFAGDVQAKQLPGSGVEAHPLLP